MSQVHPFLSQLSTTVTRKIWSDRFMQFHEARGVILDAMVEIDAWLRAAVARSQAQRHALQTIAKTFGLRLNPDTAVGLVELVARLKRCVEAEGVTFQALCQTLHLDPKDATWEEILRAVERLATKDDLAHVEHGDPVG